MLTLKFTILAIIVVVTGGAWFPDRFRKYRLLILLVGIVSTLSTVFLFRDIYSEMKAEITHEVSGVASNADRTPPAVNFASAIEGLAIPTKSTYQVHDWEHLKQSMPWIRLPIDPKTGKEDHIFQSCEKYDKAGKAKFLFNSVAPMNFAGDEVIEWTVQACGSHAGVNDITFHSDHTRMRGQVFEGLKKDLTEKGFNITYLGCNGIWSDPHSYYKLTKSNILPLYITMYTFDSSVSSYIIIKLSFDTDSEMDTKDCSANIDILGVKYPSCNWTINGCPP
jgi:hypothetical protein